MEIKLPQMESFDNNKNIARPFGCFNYDKPQGVLEP
jgi:hypothetical protein